MMNAVLIQLIGFAGLAFMIAAYQSDKRKSILKLQFVAMILFATHFFSLGAFTGAMMNILGAGRSVVFWGKRPRLGLLGGYLCLVWIVGASSWQSWVSLLPIVGASLATIALWQQNPRTIRLISLTVSPFWFTYNFINGSYPGMMADVFVFSSILVAVYRFDIRKQPIGNVTSQTETTGV